MTTLDDVKRLIDAHDFLYEFSDDYKEWEKGRERSKKIRKHIETLQGEERFAASEYWVEHCQRMYAR